MAEINDRRARRLTRKEIRDRDDDLEVSWLREDDEKADDGATEPDHMLAAAQAYLSQALDQVKALAEELDRDDDERSKVDAP